MKKPVLLSCLAFLLTFASCDFKPLAETSYELSVSSEALSIMVDEVCGMTVSLVPKDTEAEYFWNVSPEGVVLAYFQGSEASFLGLSEGEAVVTVHTHGIERKCVISVSDEAPEDEPEPEVPEEPLEPETVVFGVSPQSVSLGPEESTFTIRITADKDAEIRVTHADSWIRMTGRTDTTMIFKAAENLTTEPRESILRFTGLGPDEDASVTVTQSADQKRSEYNSSLRLSSSTEAAKGQMQWYTATLPSEYGSVQSFSIEGSGFVQVSRTGTSVLGYFGSIGPKTVRLEAQVSPVLTYWNTQTVEVWTDVSFTYMPNYIEDGNKDNDNVGMFVRNDSDESVDTDIRVTLEAMKGGNTASITLTEKTCVEVASGSEKGLLLYRYGDVYDFLKGHYSGYSYKMTFYTKNYTRYTRIRPNASDVLTFCAFLEVSDRFDVVVIGDSYFDTK